MLRRDIIFNLIHAGYRPEIPYQPETLFINVDKGMTVKVGYGGRISIWYKKHPKHICWSGPERRFYDRSD